jgi:hypothetical protein
MLTRRNLGLVLFASLSFSLLPTAAHAGDKTADQIIGELINTDPMTYGGAEAQLQVSLVNSKGHVRKRKMLMMSRHDREKNIRRSFIRFLAPSDIAGTSFLGEDKNGDRTQHVFLPALKKSRRVSSKQRNSRFAGTDYSFADLDSRDIEDSTRKRLSDAKVEGRDCYVIEVNPTDKASEYKQIRLAIDKKTGLPLVINYFNKKGKESKRFLTKEVKKKGGNWVIAESKMTDIARNHATTMKVAAIKFRKDIPLEQFTVRALERQ